MKIVEEFKTLQGKGRYSENQDNSPENLQTLCLRCHGRKDGKRGGRGNSQP